MGAKHLPLAAKFQTVLHELRIKCYDWRMVESLLKSMVAITTDYGVESKLQTVPSFSANQVISMWNGLEVHPNDWLVGRSILSKEAVQAEFEVNEFEEDGDNDYDEIFSDCEVDHFVPPETFLPFQESIRVPGVEHLTQNALEAACNKLDNWDGWIKTATQVGTFFHGTYYMDMLESSNFNVPQAQWVLRRLKSADFVVPYTKRFGSVVQFLHIWVQIRFEVQKFFNPAQWTKPGHIEEPKDDDDEAWVDINKVTDAIMGEDFGAMAVALYTSNQPVEEIRSFSRRCPCHRHSFMADLSADVEANAHGVEEDSISTYHKRMQNMKKKDWCGSPLCGERLGAAVLRNGGSRRNHAECSDLPAPVAVARVAGNQSSRP